MRCLSREDILKWLNLCQKKKKKKKWGVEENGQSKRIRKIYYDYLRALFLHNKATLLAKPN